MQFFDRVDHIDGDTENNKLSNLRRSNAKLNGMNQTGNGYWKATSNRWQVTVRPNNIFFPRCPYYATEAEAKTEAQRRKKYAYEYFEKEYNGLEEKAQLIFPVD